MGCNGQDVGPEWSHCSYGWVVGEGGVRVPRAARICPGIDRTGCINLIHGKERYCSEHLRERQKAVDKNRPSSSQRGYDAEWQKIRSEYLAEHPQCARCTEKAIDVHHIIPKRAGGTDDWDNLEALCHSHHSSVTRRGG